MGSKHGTDRAIDSTVFSFLSEIYFALEARLFSRKTYFSFKTRLFLHETLFYVLETECSENCGRMKIFLISSMIYILELYVCAVTMRYCVRMYLVIRTNKEQITLIEVHGLRIPQRN